MGSGGHGENDFGAGYGLPRPLSYDLTAACPPLCGLYDQHPFYKRLGLGKLLYILYSTNSLKKLPGRAVLTLNLVDSRLHYSAIRDNNYVQFDSFILTISDNLH